MTEFKKVRAVLGLVAATALITGCSGESTDGAPGSGPALDLNHTISSKSVRPPTGCTGPNGTCTHTVSGRIPIARCIDDAGVIYNASYVLALPTLDPYYPTPDGFKMRFPTGWITYQSDFYPYAYERGYRGVSVGLINVAPTAGAPDASGQRHEYFVHAVSYSNGFIYERPDSDMFFVGVVDGSHAQSNAIYNYQHIVVNGVQVFEEPADEVMAMLGHCVYVLEADAQGVVSYTGEFYPTYEEHDPITTPW